MKKIFALLLMLMILVPCIIACSCGDNTTDGSTPVSNNTTDTSTGSSKPSTDSSTNNSTVNSEPSTDNSQPSTDNSEPSTDNSTAGSTVTSTPSSTVPSTPNSGETPDVPPVPTKNWNGKTLNVLATIWIADTDPSYPWSQVELTVGANDWTSDANFGNTINVAVLQRAQYIKENYGVTINWIDSRGPQISNLLSASMTGGTKYDIAMPRMMEVQTLVKNQIVYELGKSDYINLSNSYYSQASLEAYTVQGHTLFAAGDFSFLDEQTSFLIYYNMAMSEGIANFPNLYEKVRKGEWTIDEMTNVAKLVKENLGSPEWNDEDKYGFGTTNLTHFFHYSGIKEAAVDAKTGKYVITLNDSRVDALIEKILGIQSADWAHSFSGYSAMDAAFKEGRLLFYDEVVQKVDAFENQTDDFRVGLLPAPMLSTSQEKYYTACSYQSVAMCIPKCTTDREMSEYFFEVLSYTGQTYVMKAYKENIVTKLDPATAADSLDMINNYIFANLTYDVGSMDGWSGLLSSVLHESISTGKNNFTQAYGSAVEDAKLTIAAWNTNWGDYWED